MATGGPSLNEPPSYDGDELPQDKACRDPTIDKVPSDTVLLPPQFCSNPLCQSKERVTGEFKLCSACKTVRYCGRDCQVQHWKEHKPACNARVKELTDPNFKAPGKNAQLGETEDPEVIQEMMKTAFTKPWNDEFHYQRVEELQRIIEKDVKIYIILYKKGIVAYSRKKFREQGRGLIFADISTEHEPKTKGMLKLMYLKPEILSHADFGTINEDNRARTLVDQYNPKIEFVIAFTWQNYVRGAPAYGKIAPVMQVLYDPSKFPEE